MDSKLWMKHESVLHDEDTKLSAVFPAGGLQFPVWSLDSKVKEDHHLFETCVTPECFCSKPFYKDPFEDELATLLDGFWDGLIIEDNMPPKEDVGVFNNTAIEGTPKEEDTTHWQQDNKEDGTIGNKRVRKETTRVDQTYEEVSRYFYMPIVEAAKELNVGLTQLKKKCRELGIPRWPHRKMKSMQTLIRNLQELGPKEGFLVSSAIEILEQEQKLMEMMPSVEMQDDTRRLRQACFKANYKKRKLMAGKGRIIDY